MSLKSWLFPKKQDTVTFVQCPNCGGNMLPFELFCPHCNFVDAAEVRGWVYTGPAAVRVRCDSDGKQIVPFKAAISIGEHPGVVIASRVFKAVKLETVAKNWVPVAILMVDNRPVVYMTYTEEVDRGRGGFVIDRLTFPGIVDNSILRLATHAKRTGTGFFMEVE